MSESGARRPGRGVAAVSVYLLFCMTIMLSVLLLALSAAAHRRVAEQVRAADQARVAMHYIRNKLSAADAAGAIAVETWQGMQTLVLRQQIDGAPYETRIYHYADARGGALYEQFVSAGDAWLPEEGAERIASVDALALRQEGDLLTWTLTAGDGQAHTMRYRLRAAAGGGI